MGYPKTLVFLVLAGSVFGGWVGARDAESRKERFSQLYKIRGTGAQREICFDYPVQFRIGVMEAQDTIEVTCDSAYRVISDSTILSVPSGARRKFKLGQTTASRRKFWPIVATVLNGNPTELEQVKARWKGLGYKITVFPAGAKLFVRDVLIHDNRRFFVAVSPSETEAEAELGFQVLQEHGARPWVFETIMTEAVGTMTLLDEQGTALATFDAPARLSSSKPIKVFRVEYGVGYPWHGFQDRSFRGTLEVRVDKVGKLQLIDAVDMESYLQGVVPSEMSASYPHEALCAQSVAARGETLAKFSTRHISDPYDLCATQHCQVYSGLAKEHVNTNKAVQATRGEILQHKGLIADTVYSACCGGHTENNDFVWSTGPSGALRGVPDLSPSSAPFPSPATEEALAAWFASEPKAWCHSTSKSYRSRFRWTKVLTSAEIDLLVAKKYPELGSVRELNPLGRGVSGRLRALQIVGTKKTAVIQKELPIRRLFGGLNSGAFVVEIKRGRDELPEAFTFTGAGWGHGVGMCQWGAKGMARAGHTYREILGHYFTDTSVQDINGDE